MANELVIYLSVCWCELTPQSVCRHNNEVSRGQEVKGCWMHRLWPLPTPLSAHVKERKMNRPSLLAGSCSHSQFLLYWGFSLHRLETVSQRADACKQGGQVVWWGQGNEIFTTQTEWESIRSEANMNDLVWGFFYKILMREHLRTVNSRWFHHCFCSW